MLHKYANEDVSLGSWFIGLNVEHVHDRRMCCGTPPGMFLWFESNFRPWGGAHSQVPIQYHWANPNGFILESLSRHHNIYMLKLNSLLITKFGILFNSSMLLLCRLWVEGAGRWYMCCFIWLEMQRYLQSCWEDEVCSPALPRS